MQHAVERWSQGQLRAADVPIHFHRTGSGSQPPLLLVHGFTDSGLCWARTAQALEPHFDVVMVDARNHGSSGAGRAALADLSGDLAMVIESLQLAPCLVLGHSVGASVAASLAGAYPQLISKLVLEDPPWTEQPPPAPSRDRGFRKYVEQLASQTTSQIIEQGRKQHPNWHPDEFPHWAASNQQIRADAMAMLDLGEWRELVPAIACPTLLLHADGDGLVTQALAAEVAAMNPLIRTRYITEAGHNLRREQFATFLQAVREFIDPVG
ncbi:MAG: alpha/beta fold hydrolase [Pseudomonadales bacterium]